MQVNWKSANAQCSCLVSEIQIGTGYDHENGQYYASGTQDEYWKISSVPTQYNLNLPICAYTAINTWGWPPAMPFTTNNTEISIASNYLGFGNETFSGCNLQSGNNPYCFDRDFKVCSNQTEMVCFDMWFQGDLNIVKIEVIGKTVIYGPFTVWGGCLTNGLALWNGACTVPNLPSGDNEYTLRFTILNDWANYPFLGTPYGMTGMHLQVGGRIYSPWAKNIFVDNRHYGKNVYSPAHPGFCAPQYPPSPEFNILGNGFCVTPPALTSFTITPFNNGVGENIYAINGTGGSTVLTSGIFSVGVGSYVVTSTDAKGCSTTKAFDVYGNPTLSLTPISQCIAPGTFSNVNASAIGASPFVYSINGGSYSSTSVFNLSQGAYTVTVKDASGCTGSATAKIGNVFSAFLESNTSNSLCHPDVLVASTYPAITPMYYSFNGSASSTINTFNTTGAGVYTVVATDAFGCTASSTVIVKAPPTVTATASPCAAPPPGNIVITATASGGGGSYTYQLNSGAWQASNVFNVSASGLYTITVSSANGCTSSTTIITPPMTVNCCNPAVLATGDYYNGWTVPLGTSNFPPLGGTVYGYNNVTTNIIIDGIVNVSAGTTLKFNGCPNILMGPNAEFVLQNNGTLIIENSILKAACMSKWKGITGTDGSQTIRLLKPSEFHDMYGGVSVSGSSTGSAALLECEGVSFIDDDYGVIFRNTQSGYAGYVRSSHFISTSNMLGPVLRTKRGVSIYDCKEVEIGGMYAGTTILGNKFENLDNGIFISANIPTTSPVLSSNIRSYNNFFTGITGGKQVNDLNSPPGNNIYSSDLGCAIYAKNYSPFYPQADIKLTVDNLDYKTYSIPVQQFLNCDKGIITSNVSLNLSHTMMYNTKAGCLNTFTDGRQFVIRGNFFGEVMKAISVVGFNLNVGKVSDNRIETSQLQPLIGGGPGTFFPPVGIALERTITSPITSATSYFHINANTIWIRSEGGIGIDLLSGGNDKIFDNVIEHINNNTAGVSYSMVPEFTGIQLTNSHFCDVKFNSIMGNNITRNYYGSNSAIKLSSCKYTDLHCNVANNTKYGFLVISDCSTAPSAVIGNLFDNHIYAMLFLHLGSEGSLGSAIGSPAAGTIPGLDPDNKFGSTSYPFGHRLFKNSVCLGMPPLERYYTSPLTLTNAQSGWNNVSCRYDVQNIGTPTSKPNCNILPHFKLAGSLAIDSFQDLIAIATGSVIYPEFEEGTRWMDEQNLYNLLNLDTVLRYSHPALDSFYTERDNTANDYIRQTDDEIGMMLDSLSLLNPILFSHHLQNAQDGNANIVSVDQEAMNVQLINQVYFKIIEHGLDAINVIDDSLIQTFALSCPFVTGIATYKARALYSMYNSAKLYDDLAICNAVGIYKGENNIGRQIDFLNDLNGASATKESGNEEIRIYPNPASDYLNISYHLQEGQKGMLLLYDMVGREQNRIYLSAGVNKVQVGIINLQPEVYAYKYLIDGIVHGTGKLVIK